MSRLRAGPDRQTRGRARAGCCTPVHRHDKCMRERMRLGAFGIACWVMLMPACGGFPASASGPRWTRGNACAVPVSVPQVEVGVVLVAIDGVREREVFEGVDPKLARKMGLPGELVVGADALMPNVHSLTRARGFMMGGAGRASMMVSDDCHCSLPGYVEMLTGRTPLGCADNKCGQVMLPTVLDELRTRKRWDPADVAVFSSWDKIAQAASWAPSTLVLSTGRKLIEHREEIEQVPDAMNAWMRGRAKASTVDRDYRGDADTADVALRYFASRRPKFMFVGLGDTDEVAHANDYAGYLQALRKADAFVGALVATADTFEDRVTVVLVTTDHGRAKNFKDHGEGSEESARGWMAGIGVRLAPMGGASPRRLADLAPTIRSLVGLPADTHPEAGCALPVVLDKHGIEARMARRELGTRN